MANKADKDASIPADDATYVLEAGKPIYVKTADLCAMTGKSNQWIGQLTSQGILNKEQTSHGRMYDLRTNIKSYCEMLEARKEKVDSEAAKVEADKNKAEMQLKSAKVAIAVMEANELKERCIVLRTWLLSWKTWCTAYATCWCHYQAEQRWARIRPRIPRKQP